MLIGSQVYIRGRVIAIIIKKRIHIGENKKGAEVKVYKIKTCKILSQKNDVNKLHNP